MEFQELRIKLENPPLEGRRQAVLVSTGALCPINIAAKYLCEKCQIDPLVGYISPSSDLFVSGKYKSNSIHFEHRFEMARLACNEHNKTLGVIHIYPDSWEGHQPGFVNFPEVRDHFETVLKKLFPTKNLLVLYVIGADLFMRNKLWDSSGYVVVSRPGFDIDIKSSPKRDLYICSDQEYTKLLSSIDPVAFMEAIKNGQQIQNLTYISVARYLQEALHKGYFVTD